MRTRLLTSLVFVFWGVAACAIDPPPVLSAKSAIVMDEVSGKVLFELKADARRFPASTTKILTSLLLIERCRPNEILTAPKDVETVTGSSLHLKPFERMTASDLLLGLMVRSANDGAYTVAKHIGGSVEGFSKLMNERAKQIGCTNTKFHNPHGLNDPLHTTTARDLALMAREALKYPEFQKAAKTHKVQIARSLNQEDTWLISKNKTLLHDPTADGIKTGYTNPAGQCFVGSSTRDGYRIITVVLASEDWLADTNALKDWAFANHMQTRIADPAEAGLSVPVKGGEREKVRASVSAPILYAHPKDAIPNLKTEIKPVVGLEAPVAAGTKIATVTFSDGTGWRADADLKAAENLEKSRPFASMGGLSFAVVACLLGGGAYLMRRRAMAMVESP